MENPTLKQAEFKPVVLSDHERADLNTITQALCLARDNRDAPHAELDGMTYVEYYESNRKKDLSYIPPKKKNKDEIRIVSGLTREKDTTLLSTMLGMNFQPDITGFDTDDLMVAELGDNMSDMVKKSRDIENWDKKRGLLYRELISQGDVFAQEVFVEDFRPMPLEELAWDPTKDGISAFSLNERMKRVFSGCAVRMVNGKKIYMSDIHTEYIEDQDVVAVMNIYSREKAFGMYAFWERWKFVPTTIDGTEYFPLDGTTYKSWNLARLSNENQVAEIMVYRPKTNRFQILLNGVPMLPYNMPMTHLFPSGETPIAQGKLEPISGFAYSKSQPSKIKIDQEVLDETTKLMIEGMRHSRKPPMGSRGKKIYSSGIFAAGKVTPDMTPNSVFPLLPEGIVGLKAADFSFYQLIKQGIEDKTVNDSYSGGAQTGDPTATQVVQEKEQQALKLGSQIDGFVNFERRLTWNRLYNLLKNWTTPTDEKWDETIKDLKSSYRQFSVSTTLEGGQKGVKLFRFTTDAYPTEEDQQQEEEKLTEKHGTNVRVVYIDPEILRSIKYTWYIQINPVPKGNDTLAQLMFMQNLTQAMNLFGPDALNMEYVKQRFAILNNEDYNKFFKKMDVMDMLRQGMMGGAPQGSTPAPATQVGPKAAGQRSGPVRVATQ